MEPGTTPLMKWSRTRAHIRLQQQINKVHISDAAVLSETRASASMLWTETNDL